MHTARILAEHHSATSFLNALFLEWTKFEKQISGTKLSFVLDLAQDQRIYIPVQKYSILGRLEIHLTLKYLI